MVDEPAELERRLHAGGEGAWLTIGEVAAVLGAARTNVDRMLRGGRLRYKVKVGTGKHRICNPEDVLRELAERDREHGGPAAE
jgi:excisionase family DNA binding protein